MEGQCLFCSEGGRSVRFDHGRQTEQSVISRNKDVQHLEVRHTQGLVCTNRRNQKSRSHQGIYQL